MRFWESRRVLGFTNSKIGFPILYETEESNIGVGEGSDPLSASPTPTDPPPTHHGRSSPRRRRFPHRLQGDAADPRVQGRRPRRRRRHRPALRPAHEDGACAPDRHGARGVRAIETRDDRNREPRDRRSSCLGAFDAPRARDDANGRSPRSPLASERPHVVVSPRGPAMLTPTVD